LLVGLNQFVERSLLDITLLDQQRLQCPDTQRHLGELAAVIVMVVVVVVVSVVVAVVMAGGPALAAGLVPAAGATRFVVLGLTGMRIDRGHRESPPAVVRLAEINDWNSAAGCQTGCARRV